MLFHYILHHDLTEILEVPEQ